MRNACSAALLVVLTIVTASDVRAQSAGDNSTPKESRAGLWRSTLIGLGIGAAAGFGVGWMRSDFHEAQCATLECNHSLEASTLAPLGAAAGAAIGVLLYHSKPGGTSSRSTNVMLTTAYAPGTRTRGVFLRTQF